MADLKTRETEESVEEFINGIENGQKKENCLKLVDLIGEITGYTPKMWGDSIVGFGNYHYKYASGREGDWFLTGFSPRKQNLTIYIMAGFHAYNDLLQDLGKYKTSSTCLYVKRLEDINMDILKKLIKRSVEDTRARYRE